MDISKLVSRNRGLNDPLFKYFTRNRSINKKSNVIAPGTEEVSSIAGDYCFMSVPCLVCYHPTN